MFAQRPEYNDGVFNGFDIEARWKVPAVQIHLLVFDLIVDGFEGEKFGEVGVGPDPVGAFSGHEVGDFLCVELFELEEAGGGVDEDELGHDFEDITVNLSFGWKALESIVEGELEKLVVLYHVELLVAELSSGELIWDVGGVLLKPEVEQFVFGGVDEQVLGGWLRNLRDHLSCE